MRVALSRLPFATSVGMIDRIHYDAADVRAATQPAIAPCLPNCDVLMIQISNLPDSRHAGGQNPAHFPGLKPNLHVVAITAHHLGSSSCTPNELTAFAWLQFDVMNCCTERHA